jgi:hypothetical protein
MTKRVGNTVIIEPEKPVRCSRCRRVTECRDVLGDGKQVCLPCTTEDEREAYGRLMFGPPKGYF